MWSLHVISVHAIVLSKQAREMVYSKVPLGLRVCKPCNPERENMYDNGLDGWPFLFPNW